MDGFKEIILIDSRQYPDVANVLDIPAPPYGKASLLNTLAVDFEKYPDLAKISLFHVALLGPGKLYYNQILGISLLVKLNK